MPDGILEPHLLLELEKRNTSPLMLPGVKEPLVTIDVERRRLLNERTEPCSLRLRVAASRMHHLTMSVHSQIVDEDLKRHQSFSHHGDAATPVREARPEARHEWTLQ